ncbi:caspase family protein [Aliterella atlantica]|uniref:Peptidase C14 caspase domain-containing protein n=1 Tax=Aliterella atlantica CENA595 TaxID=1618023 RepID=A0A0D8ZT23_9CYAN|nr:caspase family protein [Aliterella atlantica]KJH71639.1 hypothetical protein UH38_11245 [Aliterella atlantica CENA595]
MKRRDFFKATGWILAALGISESDWLRLGDRYYQAIASPLNRKLALLVGINQYPGNSSLNGCLTDVELQKELLIHRFGFKSSDILTLTNAQATRRQIEDAFSDRLIEQAQPGDVVVFHFSGCGRRLQLSQKGGDKGDYRGIDINSLVTADSGTDNDLPEHTLALMLRSLSTSAVTTVLDTSFYFPNVLPNYLRVRSLPQLEQWQLIPEELAFQQQLIDKQMLEGKLTDLQMPGTLLRAADTDKVAVEAQWTGLVAGLFTYALTQYLWEFTSPNSIQINLGKVGGVVEQTHSKQKFSNKSVDTRSLLLMPDSTIAGADGVVRAIEDDGKSAQLWLAGLPATLLEYYGVNSRLTVVEPKKQWTENLDTNSALQLQVRSRTGLTAKAQIVSNNSNSLQVGQLLQEAIRVLPRNISLNVALDPSLERIERVDATSAFAAMPRVSLVTANDVPVDYLFGRVIESKEVTTPASRYGLFFDDRKPIPLAAGEAGEAVKVAVQRLIPKLRSLLAAKLWRLTNNSGSSRLGVQATLEIVSPEQIIVTQQYAARSQVLPTPGKSLQNISLQLPTIPVGSRIQYRLQNYSDRPVYFLLVGLDSTKSAIALYPLQTAPESNTQEAKPLLQDLVIPPVETMIVPQTAVDFQWLVHPPLAIAETHLIFSTASFTQTLAALQNGMRSGGEQGYIGTLANPLEVAQAVFQDLHNASAVKSEPITTTADTYNLNVNTWASFNFIYQIV